MKYSKNLKEALTYLGIAVLFVVLAYAFVPDVLSGKIMNQSDTSAWRGMTHEIAEHNAANPDDKTLWTNSMFGGMPTVAMYDEPQILPLPDMYGKNLTFKTGGVDGCDCAEILRLIAGGQIDTTPLITHRFPLARIDEAYRLFEQKADGVMKIAIF